MLVASHLGKFPHEVEQMPQSHLKEMLTFIEWEKHGIPETMADKEMKSAMSLRDFAVKHNAKQKDK
jgi:hypothetical protein